MGWTRASVWRKRGTTTVNDDLRFYEGFVVCKNKIRECGPKLNSDWRMTALRVTWAYVIARFAYVSANVRLSEFVIARPYLAFTLNRGQVSCVATVQRENFHRQFFWSTAGSTRKIRWRCGGQTSQSDRISIRKISLTPPAGGSQPIKMLLDTFLTFSDVVQPIVCPL